MLDENMLYCYTREKGLLAIEISSRKIFWQVKTDWYGASITLSGDTIFVNHGNLTAFDKQNGEKLWSASNDFSASHLVKCDNFLLGYVSGYSNIDIIGAASALSGNLKMLGWEDSKIFQKEEARKFSEDIDTESNPNAAPVLNFSRNPYRGFIFGRYENSIYAFKILEKAN